MSASPIFVKSLAEIPSLLFRSGIVKAEELSSTPSPTAFYSTSDYNFTFILDRDALRVLVCNNDFDRSGVGFLRINPQTGEQQHRVFKPAAELLPQLQQAYTQFTSSAINFAKFSRLNPKQIKSCLDVMDRIRKEDPATAELSESKGIHQQTNVAEVALLAENAALRDAMEAVKLEITRLQAQIIELTERLSTSGSALEEERKMVLTSKTALEEEKRGSRIFKSKISSLQNQLHQLREQQATSDSTLQKQQTALDSALALSVQEVEKYKAISELYLMELTKRHLIDKFSRSPDASTSLAASGGAGSSDRESPRATVITGILKEYIEWRKAQMSSEDSAVELSLKQAYENENPFIILSSSSTGSVNPDIDPLRLEKLYREQKGFGEKDFFIINHDSKTEHWDSSYKCIGRDSTEKTQSSGKDNACGIYTLLNIIKNSALLSAQVRREFPDSAELLSVGDVNDLPAVRIREFLAKTISEKSEVLTKLGAPEEALSLSAARIQSSGVQLESEDIKYACNALNINVIEANTLTGVLVPDAVFKESIGVNLRKADSNTDRQYELQNIREFCLTQGHETEYEAILEEITLSCSTPSVIAASPKATIAMRRLSPTADQSASPG